MEVVVPEEKKKIFRARKTMKMSDRLQLESLHSTLLTTPGSSNPSPPPLMNGTHKEDGQKTSDKEQNNISDSNSPAATSPASPTSLSSPTPFLSLNLSPSPASSESPKPQDEASCPNSPLSPDFPDAKKTEDKEKKSSSSSYPDDSVTPVPSECKDQQKNGISTGEKEEKQTNTEDPAGDSGTDSSKEAVSTSPAPPSTSKCIKPMETETNTTNADDSEASTSTRKDENSSCSSVTTSTSTLPPGSGKDINETIEIKEDDVEEEEDEKPNKNTESKSEEKMEVDKIQSEFRKETKEDEKCTKPARPSSTPPSNPDKEGKSSTSGLKRTLSEGDEKDDVTVKMEGKRPKMEHEELEAHLKLKITAKAGSQHKLEKIVQQLVNEQLQILELAIFDKHFKELKDRVDKVECATKHQTAINTLQSKISRLVKKFGEANQASENKKKQEALAAATTAAAAAAAAAAVKPPTATNTPQAQRQVRTSIEVKQIPATVPSSSAAVVSVPVSVPVSIPASVAAAAPAAVSLPTPTSTTMVPQGSILQLITSNANAASTLATGITTQSQPGTLVLKTTPGSGMVTAGQPLVIQLPLSVNGQTGTLVNFPVSSLSAASSLNKSKTTPSTTTFILKSPPSTNAVSASTSTLGTLPTLQASTGQLSTTQFSVARTVYQGGASRITTPNAGVSVTTVRAPAQSVSVAGALSSAASPATSGPAATGSTAPGTPQGTSLTSKTDNQVAVTIPPKPAVVPPPPPPPPPPAAAAPSAATPVAATPVAATAARPKGSVIDLTEDDDDVQVTGVKNATVTTPSSAPRPNPVIRIPDSTGARSSPKTNLSSTSSPQVTVHHRPPLDSSLKPRTVTTTTAPRGSSAPLPPLPSAPAPLRLPPEAEQTSPPQQLQLKLVPGQTGIVLSWSVSETDRSCAAVDSYHLYAFHQDNSNSGSAQQHWKKIGEVNALPLPMACTLTQFQSGSTYYFAVRAKDIYGRFGAFCEPQCTNVISSGSS
ncbi:transcript variant X3 [Nothobranchius furzeri]|uniref:Transcript variant X3 n=1 Tax=Nothobranchius furzeri TaxID=105023 RepID=A0A9D2Y2R5_NOTFU|nr:transcript variant X3 [Nothobranchius furzeri]